MKNKNKLNIAKNNKIIIVISTLMLLLTSCALVADNKAYVVDNLVLPSKQELYYEIPYEGYDLGEDAALGTETINYRFKFDDTEQVSKLEDVIEIKGV